MATAIPNKTNLYIIKQSKVYILILTFISQGGLLFNLFTQIFPYCLLSCSLNKYLILYRDHR